MKVLITGAGPAGLLMANYLIRRPGYHVNVVERRSDPRGLPPDSLRSYPISLQERGLEALREVPGLEASVDSQGIRPAGVCFHQGEKDQNIPIDPPKLFVDHSQLTLTLLENLMNAVKKKDTSLSIDFDCSLNDVDLDKKAVSVLGNTQAKKSIPFDKLVAADGGRSKIRQQLEQAGELSAEQKDIPDEYRTISLSRTSPDGSLQLDSEYLHAWVLEKGRVRIVAAPIHDDCLSGAFVFDKDYDPIQGLKSPQDVQDYFEKVSPTSLAKLITLDEAKRLLEQPASSLVTVRCDRLHVQDSVVLLGDAAHAMSQAVGHGCISAFQDVHLFCRLLDEYEDDWQQALPTYTRTRLDDAHALNVMSEYAAPTSKLLKVEWGIRQMLKKVLPSALGRFMRPLPVELLSDTTLSYKEVLEQSSWWIDRVKSSKSTVET